jgi:hypothetical protein
MSEGQIFGYFLYVCDGGVRELLQVHAKTSLQKRLTNWRGIW